MKTKSLSKTFANGRWKTTALPVDMEEESHFMKYHDAERFGVLACNVHRYTFIVNNGNPKTSAMVTLAHTMEG
jgi:hypothetical protein